MTKAATQQAILEDCRTAMGMTRVQFARELGMTKQTYNTYVRLQNPSAPEFGGLVNSAVIYRGTWVGELCVKLIRARGFEPPCVCKQAIGDSGVCPKHGEVKK